MAENRELNLGSLLSTKQYDIKSAEDRTKKEKIINTALDFGEKFISGVLIDIPAAEKKVFTQANLEDDRFEAGMKRQELTAKTDFLKTREKDLDYVAKFETPEKGFRALAEKNWLATAEGKKFTDAGGLSVYQEGSMYKTNQDFLNYYDDYMNLEGARLQKLYKPFIDDPNLIIDLQQSPQKLSKALRNSLYAETYENADRLYNLTTFLKNKLGNEVGSGASLNYLVDETEKRIEERLKEIKEIADFNTLDGRKRMGDDFIAPFTLTRKGDTYTGRKSKLNDMLQNLESKKGKDAIETFGNFEANRILVLDGELKDVVSATMLSSAEREQARENNNVSPASQNIFREQSTLGPVFGVKYPGKELREAGEDVEADRLVRVRQKQTDKDGNVTFVEQDITLAEALISDVALGAEFFKHRDEVAGGFSRVQANDTGLNYEKQYMQLLVESGNIWLNKEGTLYYDRPAAARDLSLAQDLSDEDLSKGFNEVDAINAQITNRMEKEALSADDFLNNSIAYKINSLKDSPFDDESKQTKIAELENLNEMKDRQKEFLMNLINPNQELRGKMVKYAKNYFTAGELSDRDRTALYINYINKYNDGEDDLLLKNIYKIK